jgi:hypothetical protein
MKSWATGRRLISIPCSDYCEPLVGNIDEFKAMLEEIRFLQKDWKFVEIRPLQLSPDLQSGFALSQSFHFHKLDLGSTIDQLFDSFDKHNVQRRIRRAERAELSYTRGQSEEELIQFYSLMVLTRRRHRWPPPPIEWYRNLLTFLRDSATIHLVCLGERPIAGLFTLTYSSRMTAKYACSDPNFRHLAGPALTFWNSIKEAKSRGLLEYDFGRSDTNNEGLIRFKNRWATRNFILRYWRYPAASVTGNGTAGTRLAQEVLGRMPIRWFASSGKMLYRHFA